MLRDHIIQKQRAAENFCRSLLCHIFVTAFIIKYVQSMYEKENVMKKFTLIAAAALLMLAILAGCDKPQEESPVIAEPSIESEDDVPSDSADTAYTRQIERYYTAISEQWDENAYFDNEMSSLAAYYYEGNALDNIGFALIDLDGDESRELIIGAIMNAETDPLVFEIWTLKDDEPVMLAQSGSRNRYYLQYAEDGGIWSVAYEAENGAANHAVYYLQLTEGEFAVVQGVIFDAVANESEPWFMAYDLDWDVSNDTPIDEETANDVMESERNFYTATEYTPFGQYK